MLYDFIVANRDLIIARAEERVRERSPKAPGGSEQHGVPLFLTQLVGALARVGSISASDEVRLEGTRRQIADTAAHHGRHQQTLGYSVDQVVRGYGDICQVVTELASEKRAAISSQDFQVFNGCLDDAIAGAVTAFGRQRESELADAGTERLGILAHELRNLINTAVLSFDVIKKGTVGVGGSTASVHVRSLAGLRSLVERSLAEVRLEADTPILQPVTLAEFIEEIEIGAALQAEELGIRFSVDSGDTGVAIDVDRHLLASAVSNLLQNAFKFTRSGGNVSLLTRVTEDRVLIEVSDQCGGLPAGRAEEMFRPFTRAGSDRSGLGLGLSIAQRAVRANLGSLRVRDVPGRGCVFSIDLPRGRPPAGVGQ